MSYSRELYLEHKKRIMFLEASGNKLVCRNSSLKIRIRIYQTVLFILLILLFIK